MDVPYVTRETWMTCLSYARKLHRRLREINLAILLGACPVTAGQRTDVNTPEHVQPIRQGCPLTLGITPL